MNRRAFLAAPLLALVAARGLAETPQSWSLTIIPEPVADEIFAGEMLLVRLRGVYGGGIALESMQAPAMSGLSWVQLGKDRWFDEMVDGLERRIFERRYAMWPERAGRIEIPRFSHDMTLIPRRGVREEVSLVAEPVILQVSPPPIDGSATPDRWLPVSRLDVREAWTGRTDALAIGEIVTRTVTLVAGGVTPDRMPSTPNIDTDAVFAFAEEESRSVALTPDGPVTTVVWRWTITPDTPEPTLMPPLRIAWFDTVAREMRETVLPAKRIAVEGSVFGVERRSQVNERLAPVVWPAGFAAGLASGLLALWAVARRRGLSLGAAPGGAVRRARRALAPVRARLELWRARAGLRAAARRGDVFAARRAARRVAALSDVDPARLAAFDRWSYGGEAASPEMLRRAAALL